MFRKAHFNLTALDYQRYEVFVPSGTDDTETIYEPLEQSMMEDQSITREELIKRYKNDISIFGGISLYCTLYLNDGSLYHGACRLGKTGEVGYLVIFKELNDSSSSVFISFRRISKPENKMHELSRFLGKPEDQLFPLVVRVDCKYLDLIIEQIFHIPVSEGRYTVTINGVTHDGIFD
jgi:hypothetical protein